MNHTARHLCDEIVKALSLPEDLKQKLETYFADKFVHVWCAEDVVSQALLSERGLSLKEVQSIVEDIEIDSSLGMNWEVIDVWIDDTIRARKLFPKDREFYIAHKEDINALLLNCLGAAYGCKTKRIIVILPVIEFVERVFNQRIFSDVGKEVDLRVG